MSKSTPKERAFQSDGYTLFINLLIEKRKSLGLRQRALSRLLKKHHTYVNVVEHRERQLNIIELREWCQALRISFPDFITELDTALTEQEKAKLEADSAESDTNISSLT